MYGGMASTLEACDGRPGEAVFDDVPYLDSWSMGRQGGMLASRPSFININVPLTLARQHRPHNDRSPLQKERERHVFCSVDQSFYQCRIKGLARFVRVPDWSPRRFDFAPEIIERRWRFSPVQNLAVETCLLQGHRISFARLLVLIPLFVRCLARSDHYRSLNGNALTVVDAYAGKSLSVTVQACKVVFGVIAATRSNGCVLGIFDHSRG